MAWRAPLACLFAALFLPASADPPPKRVLAVLYHPSPRGSYTAAVLDAAIGALPPGTHVDVMDLTREGFDPRFSERDLAHFRGGPREGKRVRAMQARIDAADAIVIAFPIWWWSLPATLKGWIDRVFTRDWAYKSGNLEEEGPGAESVGLLKDRPTLLLAAGAGRRATFDKWGYADAMQRQISVGIFGYCGIRDVHLELLLEDEDAEARKRNLRRAAELGRALLDTGRTNWTAVVSDGARWALAEQMSA
ncbi:putative NAD(P)H dehydrogenase [Hyaloraphidium curvatum]|nr:putative NAD(P)H dehydrogenase [Hyaloraphidium curvatum]